MAKPTDKRSDIYSLGCLMYECIVGQPPFRSDSEYLTMSRQLSEALPENLKLSSYPQLDGLIKRCLEKNPDKRFADVADLTLALDNLELSKTPTTAPRTQRTLIGGLCALVVAGLATTGVKLWQNHRTQPVAPFSVLDVQAVTNSWLDHNEQASTTEQRSMLLRECIIRQKSNPRKAYDIYRVYGLLCTKGSPSRQDLADMEAFYQSSGGETSQAPGWQHNLREVHACRAACMTHLGRLDDAVLEYRKALTHAQHNKETLDDFVLHRTIGQTLMEQKRYDAALKEFELMHTSKCAGDNPKRHLQAYCLEGAACMALNKLPEARKKLDTAKEIVCEICSSPTDLQPAETALTLARMFRTLGSSGELGAATVLVQRATMLRETYKPTPANVAGYVDTCVFAAEVIPGQWPVTEVTEFYSECWARLCRMTLDQSPRIRFLEGAARAYSQCQDRKGLNWVQEQLDKMAPRSAADLACAKRIKELCKQ